MPSRRPSATGIQGQASDHLLGVACEISTELIRASVRLRPPTGQTRVSRRGCTREEFGRNRILARLELDEVRRERLNQRLQFKRLAGARLDWIERRADRSPNGALICTMRFASPSFRNEQASPKTSCRNVKCRAVGGPNALTTPTSWSPCRGYQRITWWPKRSVATGFNGSWLRVLGGFTGTGWLMVV